MQAALTVHSFIKNSIPFSPFELNSFQTKMKPGNRLQSLELLTYTARSTMKEAGKDLLGGTAS